MANAYYTCNLVPLGLLTRNGYTARWLGNAVEQTQAPLRREALSVHPMTCPFVTRLVAAGDLLLSEAPPEDRVVVPGGCDAMRRAGDLLSATYPGRVFVLPMPRANDRSAVERMAGDLGRLDAWLARGVGELTDGGSADPATRTAETQGGSTDAAASTGSASAQSPQVEYPSLPENGGVFVVAGPLSDDSLLRLVEDLGATVAGLESCTSPDRWRPLAELGAESGANLDLATGTEPDFFALAEQVLTVGMCPRRSSIPRREHLARRLDETKPASIIYARQSFCDPGSYDALIVAELAEERGLPFLDVEVGFPFESSGPLRTRVEAFLEAQLLDDDLLDDDLFGAPCDDDVCGEG